MKQNSQRILSWLYPLEKTSRWVSADELLLIAPELSAGGLQSVLNFLQQRKRVLLERAENQQLVSITSHGMKALEEQIPAFSPQRRAWKGDWQVLLFLDAPKQDQNFRFLRRLLLKTFSVPLSRGMYLYPGELPDTLSFELRSSYEGSVIVAQLKEFIFGDDKGIVSKMLHLTDLAATYSSISKEIDTLLTLERPVIAFTDQAKFRFSSVFDRLYLALQSDFGIQEAYFPQGENGVDLLLKLQKLTLSAEK